MKSMTRSLLLVALATAFGTATAEAQAVPQGATPAMVERGKEIFTKQGLCYACHGQEGKGLVGPNLTDATWIHGKGSWEEIIGIVNNGIPKEQAKGGIPMPAKGGSSISDDDVKAVAAYVYSLSHK
ncbi:MAG: c-type cytochrome [Gemmatimonadetes bacterium]|nr:c-type cytochrome [Gemmatimonadota bacterium]